MLWFSKLISIPTKRPASQGGDLLELRTKSRSSRLPYLLGGLIAWIPRHAGPVQTLSAKRIIGAAAAGISPGFIPTSVLSLIAWIRISPQPPPPPHKEEIDVDHKAVAWIGGSIGLKLAEVRDLSPETWGGIRGTHPPSEFRHHERRIPKSRIPGSKREIDAQDPTFMAANAGAKIPSFGRNKYRLRHRD